MGRIVIYFELAGMTSKDYDAVMKELKAQNQLVNEDRPSHVAFDKDGSWCVVDVWESAEAFEKFGTETLGPIFQKLGMAPPQPKIYPAHNYLDAHASQLVSA